MLRLINHVGLLVIIDKLFIIFYDTLPSSLIDSSVNLKWKQQKSKELGHAP